MFNFNGMDSNKPIVIASDVDEVITNISPLWTELLNKDTFFSSLLKEDMPKGDYRDNEFITKVLSRPYFDLLKSYAKDEELITDKVKERFFSLYNHTNFYQLCTYTKFGNGLSRLLYTRYINKLYIVTRTMDNTLASKKALLDHLFKDNIQKVEYIFIDKNQTKGDIINNIGNVDVYIDDELTNVFDVINKNKEREMDIFIPYMGYNVPTESLEKMSEENNKKVSYYSPL